VTEHTVTGLDGTEQGEIPCVAMVELVTSYLEGVLTPAQHERFERHLGFCDGCDAYVEQMREVIVATGALAPEDLDPTMLNRLIAAFRDWREHRDGPDSGPADA
jgi:anti-sigma factor RsiW